MTRKLFASFVCGVVLIALSLIAIRYSGLREIELHSAAKTGNVFLVKVLLLLGADVNSPDSNGGTALFEAAAHARTEAVKLLLDSGASVTIQDNRGQTALSYSLGSESFESAKTDALLIKAGGLTKVPFPFGCINSSNTSAWHIDVLLKNGVSPNLAASNGTTPIVLFAENGDVRAVEFLFQNGADVNAITQHGDTALSQAVNQGNYSVVKYLLTHGANSANRIRGKSLEEIAQARLAESSGSPLMISQYRSIIELLNSGHEGSSASTQMDAISQ